MSILQIGIQSRYLQVSPGCRKYVSPFLSNQERQQIMKQKQINQNKYREVLLEQVRQKQIQKKINKQKQIEIDLKREREFYQKVKQLNNDVKNSSIRGVDASPKPSMYSNGNLNNSRMLRKQNQVTFPTIKSKLAQNPYSNFSPSSQGENYLYASRNQYDNNIFMGQNNYHLKNHSLMDIGSQFRQNRSLNFEYRNNQSKSQNRLKYMSLMKDRSTIDHRVNYDPKYGNDSLNLSNNRHKDLRIQLRQKETQIYDLLQKSNHYLQGTQNPIREMKKRLKTTPLWIEQDSYQDNDQLDFYTVKPYRVRTQFGTYKFNGYDRDESKFYRLPPGSHSSMDTLNNDRQDSTNRTFTLGKASIQTLNHPADSMMKIQQNPQEGQQQQPNQFIEKQYD